MHKYYKIDTTYTEVITEVCNTFFGIEGFCLFFSFSESPSKIIGSTPGKFALSDGNSASSILCCGEVDLLIGSFEILGSDWLSDFFFIFFSIQGFKEIGVAGSLGKTIEGVLRTSESGKLAINEDD